MVAREPDVRVRSMAVPTPGRVVDRRLRCNPVHRNVLSWGKLDVPWAWPIRGKVAINGHGYGDRRARELTDRTQKSEY